MDMSYATIPVFGIQRRIFREQKLACMVTSTERPQNHPIYLLDMEMGSAIFFTKGDEIHVLLLECYLHTYRGGAKMGLGCEFL